MKKPIDRSGQTHAHFLKQRERHLKVGITEGCWQHMELGAQGCRHAHLHGRRFDLRKGLEVDGVALFPGSTPFCRCMYNAIIPGFDEVEDHSPEKVSLFLKVWRKLFG